MKKLCVLGITGSIGRNVADVVKQNPDDFVIIGCAFNNSIEEFKKIYAEHKSIKYVYVGNTSLKDEMSDIKDIKVFYGENGLTDLIGASNYDMVVNALVGFAGLVPTVEAIKRKINVALANKETLVAGGDLVNRLLIENNVKLFPIDSEHSAIYKLLKQKNREDVDSLIITASGGSFRDLNRDQLKNVTVKEALKHPSWKMGAKITIDCANMINKGFEIIEAYQLFHFPENKIKVLLHDESVIHSAIQLKDHSLMADLGIADMRVPISYALYECNYHDINNIGYLDLETLGSLHFRKFDSNRYPGVELARIALRTGGSMPCVLNASNEAANLAFREGKIAFLSIEKIIEKVMNKHDLIVNPDLDDLIKTNIWAYNEAVKLIESGEY